MESLLSLYYAYFHTYVNYANLATASIIRINFKKIHSPQKCAICIILRKDKFSHARQLFVQNKVFNTYQLNILNNLIFMHKVKTETAPVAFLPKFWKPAHPYPTNGSVKIAPQKTAPYDYTHLWKFPPLKIVPLKIAPQENYPQKINPKKIVPYESCHHSREKLKVVTMQSI